MSQVNTNQLKLGMKIELDNEPYTITLIDFVKPGKGQAFTRTKLKHLTSGRILEKTFKSGEKLEIADVHETKMRLLYQEGDSSVFMDDNSFEQISIPATNIGDTQKWLKEDCLYDVIFYKDNAVDVSPPTFMELKITETEPGMKGDTASGRVMKPATVETGAKIQIPIFIDEGEMIKVDTRSGEYVSRV